MDRLWKRVMRELEKEVERRQIMKYDTSKFRFEEHEDALMFICYSHLCEFGSPIMIDTMDDVKRYIMSYDECAKRLKEEKSYCWAHLRWKK